MQVRRTLTAAVAVCLTSFALVTAAAQAAPSPSALGSHGPGITLAKKVKGAKTYNLYFDPYFEGEYFGYQLEPHFLVFSKTKTWGFELEPGVGYTYGPYETVKVSYKIGKEKIKYSYTYFYYGSPGETYLFGYVNKTGWEGGEYIVEGEYSGAWYAEKA